LIGSFKLEYDVWPFESGITMSVNWSIPAVGDLGLGAHEIHVWRASLNLAPTVLRNFEATLAADENSRADRFVFAGDRDSFVAARGILRELLGRYLQRSPSEVSFSYGRRGKPAYQASSIESPIDFNLSHSHGRAVYAIARGRQLGVDVEMVRSTVASEGIAERFFSERECAELRALPHLSQAPAFFNCWTRKEAYIKALGDGLEIPLNSFDVALAPGVPERFLRGVDSRWHLVAFAAYEDYPAALVYDGAPCPVHFFSWAGGET
jgi:4'-phosphopantetheinyl transferase